MADLRTLAQALTDAEDALHAPGPQGGLEATLDAIAEGARARVPGFEHVGVSVVPSDGAAVTTLACTDGFVLEMDNLQYSLGEGPCLSALGPDRVVLAEDLAGQGHTWPAYAPEASRAGVRAQMGIRVHDDKQTLGILNFYSTASATVDPGAPDAAALFAAQAAVALGHARQRDSSPQRAPVIGQAVGILMERYVSTEDQAMYYLVRVATVARLEVRDVAAEVVDHVNQRADIATSIDHHAASPPHQRFYNGG